jgi:hypothetical protein
MEYDLVIERSRESTLQNWIANVRDEDVIRSAAQYRPDRPQNTVECVLGGNFDVCFKVAFADGSGVLYTSPSLAVSCLQGL